MPHYCLTVSAYNHSSLTTLPYSNSYARNKCHLVLPWSIRSRTSHRCVLVTFWFSSILHRSHIIIVLSLHCHNSMLFRCTHINMHQTVPYCQSRSLRHSHVIIIPLYLYTPFRIPLVYCVIGWSSFGLRNHFLCACIHHTSTLAIASNSHNSILCRYRCTLSIYTDTPSLVSLLSKEKIKIKRRYVFNVLFLPQSLVSVTSYVSLRPPVLSCSQTFSCLSPFLVVYL